jgi:hypothetical protein
MGLHLEIGFYHLKSVGGCEGLPLGVLGRKFDSRQLLNELFYVWGVNRENLGPILASLGRFWVLSMQPFFL